MGTCRGGLYALPLDNGQKYETLRAEWDEKARRAARAVMDDKALKAGEGQRIAKNRCEMFGITPPQPAGGPPGKGGHDGVKLSNTVRRMFGVPLPGEPLPALPAPAQAPREQPASSWTPEDEARAQAMIDAVNRELNPGPAEGPPKGHGMLPPPAGEN